MLGEGSAIDQIIEELRLVNGDHVKLDAVNASLMELMVSGLVAVRSRHKKSQAWFVYNCDEEVGSKV